MTTTGDTVEFNREARFDKAIVLTADNNYVPYALFLIDQIATAHPDRDFDFCLVTQDNITPHPLIEKHSIRVCKITKLEAEDHLPALDHIPIATFLRIFTPGILGDDYRRLLYLDGDMFYLRGNLSDLLDVDMGDHAVAAVMDPVQYRHMDYTPKDIRTLGLGHFKYFNSGLQVYDTARFNKNGHADAAVKLVKENPGKILLLDQTALNAVLKGNWAELSIVWNWIYGFRTIYYAELYNPAILHFTGRRKPWNHLNGEYPAKYSEAYRAFFKKNYPDLHAAMPPCAKPSSVKRGHLRYFLTHIIGLRHFVPNVDRFENDFDIKR